ncbi:malectin domain-containing carbohydrate-binding protein [Gilvimarinus xylanilyticus]|uniref:Malectin n=1 Tax=Gilvimarinus xylanilyticus TaxID=2944139 RepID=A0A9X2HU02_9GAMM|nr:malectin [Gilvimarinus xylanilyticus]MCP8898458.1 malectin [Gilvimarinus xylanilyticus]
MLIRPLQSHCATAVLALSCVLVGCGGSDSDSDTSSSSVSSSSSSESSSTVSSSSSSSSTAVRELVLAINAGSFESAIYDGVEYQADQFASTGTVNQTQDEVSNSQGSELFQTERYGSYRYEVPVTDGDYDVTLHFVEMYWEANGERSFNLSVEGDLILSEVDLFAEVGHDSVYTYEVPPFPVSDGSLTIELEAVQDNGTLSGFAIYSENGEFVPPPPPEPGVPGEPGIASAENTGADCPVPELPVASELPNIDKLPDPFMTLEGERITTEEQWRCQRQDTFWQVQYYEAGNKPNKPEVVSGSVAADAINVNVTHEETDIAFSASVALPTGGEPPYPAIIGMGASNLDNAYLSSQGVAVINFNHNEVGAQSGAESRGTGLFYDLYGSDHSASSMTAWAWGVSRLIDVLEESSEGLIDASRLGVTGCSRNGKGALMAGAMDERIALTIPQESGAGGAVSWRAAQAQADAGDNIQTLGHAAGEQPWFRESFGETFSGSRVTHLPFDHHQLIGMVAPRGLLVIDNDIDWLGPKAAYIGTLAAKEIYRALGAPENIAYSENGGHGHCQFPGHQQEVLAAYVQRFLLGEPGNTEVMNSTKAEPGEAEAWIDWTTPSLTE